MDRAIADHDPIYGRKPPTFRKGPAVHSKRVLDRIKAVRRLRVAIEAHKDAVGAGLRAKLADELRDGETAPDLTLALELTVRSAQTAVKELAQADHVYCGRSVKRRRLNEACIHLARDEIYPELVNIRRAIEVRYGSETGRSIHRMKGNTLRKPKRQYPQLQKLVTALKNRKRLPKPKQPAPPGESRYWLKRLEPGYNKMTAMFAELKDHEMMEAALRKDRDYELEAFDVTYNEALAFVRSVFQLAGIGTKVISHLLPTVQQRRLKKKARQEREARVEGLRDR